MVVTRDMLEKAIIENDLSILNIFKQTDIGQGYGYKLDKDWEKMLPEEIIYIPEIGYKNGVINIKYAYTKKDFVKIVKDKVKLSRVGEEAYSLFIMVDWQPPEVLAEELNYDEEWEEPTGKAFDCKITCRGCRHKTKDIKTGEDICEEIDEPCKNITWCPNRCGNY